MFIPEIRKLTHFLHVCHFPSYHSHSFFSPAWAQFSNSYKSIGVDRTHLRVLEELTGVIMRLLLIVFERLWSLGKFPNDFRKVNLSARRTTQRLTWTYISTLGKMRERSLGSPLTQYIHDFHLTLQLPWEMGISPHINSKTVKIFYPSSYLQYNLKNTWAIIP